PFNGSSIWMGTNLTYGHAPQKSQSGTWEPSIGIVQPSAVEGMFFNASYGLVNLNLDCRTNGSICGLNGNGQGASAPGTVAYYWPTLADPFPYPPTVSLAQTSPPSPVTHLAVANSS